MKTPKEEYKWNMPQYKIEGLLTEQQRILVFGDMKVEDTKNNLECKIHFSQEKGLLKLPDIKLNFWSKEEKPKKEKPIIKNQFVFKIFKRMGDHLKADLAEGCGNYARFI